MKKILMLIAVMISLSPTLAPARDWGYARWEGQGQQGQKGSGEYRRGDREYRRDRDARPPRDERPGRMTEEERRELHRDLDRANREIYRPKGR